MVRKMNSGEGHPWALREWLSPVLAKLMIHCISHHVQSGASILPDVFPAYVPPACIQPCTSGVVGPNKLI